MATYVADAAWGRPAPAELQAWGYTGIVCYCSPDRTGKNITKAEVDAYLAAGLRVGLVWEWTNQRASEGGSVGTADASEFVSQAQALGASGGVLWMVGEDPNREPASDYPTINSYMAQADPILHAAGFQLGGYASEDYLVQAHKAGVLERLWLVGGWSQDLAGDLIQQSNNPAKTTNNGQVDCNYAPADAWGWTDFGGMEVLDQNDPIVQELRNEIREVHAAMFDPINNSSSDNLSGAGIPWAVNAILNKLSATGVVAPSAHDVAVEVVKLLGTRLSA